MHILLREPDVVTTPVVSLAAPVFLTDRCLCVLLTLLLLITELFLLTAEVDEVLFDLFDPAAVCAKLASAVNIQTATTANKLNFFIRLL